MQSTAAIQRHSAITIARLDSLLAFVGQIRDDADRVRHQEVRWTTEPVTTVGDQQVSFEKLTAGYITEQDGQPTLVELSRLCGRTAGDRRSEQIHAREQIAGIIEALETATGEQGLSLRQGHFRLDPSPLMPTVRDMLEVFGPSFTSLGGTTYRPWTDTWAVGLECVRHDGLTSFLYLEPTQEAVEGNARVVSHLGTGGDPTEDHVQHIYDPFAPDQLARVYAVVTENGERNWTADNYDHARAQHEEAFGGEPGEAIEDVYLADRLAGFDSAPEGAVLDAMMRQAQRLSCGHPDSPYIAVIAALRQVKEAADS
jgi:hypothetical protein